METENPQIVELSGGKFRIMGRGKKPFMRSGAGILGMMVCTLDGTRVLCHNCGKTFQSLAKHIQPAHGLNAHAYRSEYSLFQLQPLCSPAYSEQQKESMLQKIAQGIIQPGSLKEIKKWERGKEPRSNGKRTVAYMNSRDTCEAQCLRRLKQVARFWSIRPEEVSATMDKNLAAILATHYGSWNVGKARLLHVHISKMNKVFSQKVETKKFRELAEIRRRAKTECPVS